MRTATSGLVAERFRMDVISGNISNANTVAEIGKEPYRRRGVVLNATENGVKIAGITQDRQREFQQKVDWSHPNHDPVTGIVRFSNVDHIMEMVDMIGAGRAYEANIAAFNTAKTMMKSALNIGRI